MKILVVCSGNICRSPMVEGILKSLAHKYGRPDIRISSAGTYGIEDAAASIQSIRVCKEHGINIGLHRSSALSSTRIKQSDMILVMERFHEEFILEEYGDNLTGKILLITEFTEGPWHGEDVFDPYGGTFDLYRECFNLLYRCCESFAQQYYVEGKVADSQRT